MLLTNLNGFDCPRRAPRRLCLTKRSKCLIVVVVSKEYISILQGGAVSRAQDFVAYVVRVTQSENLGQHGQHCNCFNNNITRVRSKYIRDQYFPPLHKCCTQGRSYATHNQNLGLYN